MAADAGYCSVLFLLDLSAAVSDCVFSSCLSDGTMSVPVGDSCLTLLLCHVVSPRDQFSGPISLSIYILPLWQIISNFSIIS